MYGPEVTKPGTFASSCLLARRMAERDVRFVQIFHRGWDQHGDIDGQRPSANSAETSINPVGHSCRTSSSAGMLDDTLVVWGGEFGRTIYCQGQLTRENYGRDHHPQSASQSGWRAAGCVPG